MKPVLSYICKKKDEMFAHFFAKKNTQMGVVLASILAYYCYSFGQYDLVPSDEDVYFHAGLYFKLPYQAFGNFLYPMAIYLFSTVLTDPILLAYVFFFAVSIAVYLGMLFFFKKYGQRFWPAYLVATLFLFSDFQVALQPRITLLNLFLGLCMLVLIQPDAPKYRNWGITAVFMMLCNYVSRPEFFWFFVISFIIFLFFLWRSSSLSFSYKSILSVGFLGFIALFYFVAGGINEPGKLKVAFIQHFFDNYFIWYGKAFDYDEEFVVFDKIYGKVNSDFQLITANPAFFFKHVFTNLCTYFLVVLKILKSIVYDVFVPIFGHQTRYFFLFLVVLMGVFIDFKQTIMAFFMHLKAQRFVFPYLLLFLLPTCVAVLVIYPRNHYTLLHLPFYLLLLYFLISNLHLRVVRLAPIFFGGMVLTLCVALALKFPYKKSSLSHTAYYTFMAKKRAAPLHLLCNDIFGYNYYSGLSRNEAAEPIHKGSEAKEENDEKKGPVPTRYILHTWQPANQNLVELLNSGRYDVLVFYRLDLEVPQNRAFLKEEYKKTNFVLINDFKAIDRYIFVKPSHEKAFRFQ